MVMNAWISEEGLTLICPTTQLAYTPQDATFGTMGGMRYTHTRCRWCDAQNRPRTDKEFDPSNPQVHTHILTREATP